MNNYDTSTSGINLELSCFYDTHVAQCDFDENFIRIDGLNGASLLNDRFSRVSIFSYTQCGEYAKDHIKNEYVIAWLGENLPDQLEYLN